MNLVRRLDKVNCTLPIFSRPDITTAGPQGRLLASGPIFYRFSEKFCFLTYRNTIDTCFIIHRPIWLLAQRSRYVTRYSNYETLFIVMVLPSKLNYPKPSKCRASRFYSKK